MTNDNKHRWTVEEDQLCCSRYLAYFVVNKSSMDVSQFINVLQKEPPSIKPNSLKMKVQNIKQILIEKGIKDTLVLSPLAKYSQQNMRAMVAVLREINLYQR
jgi:hypothetical protein